MKDELKNIIIVVTSAITLIAILEAAGVIEWIDKDTYEIAGFCDNTGRNLDAGEKGGGMGMDSIKTAELMTAAKEVIEKNAIKIKYEYYLSKMALDSLFKDKTATGIFIAPVFEKEDSINLLVGKSHCNQSMTDPQSGFSFLIKTFCPSECEMD